MFVYTPWLKYIASVKPTYGQAFRLVKIHIIGAVGLNFRDNSYYRLNSSANIWTTWLFLPYPLHHGNDAERHIFYLMC